MTQVTVDINDPEVRRIFSDWDGPVGHAIDAVIDQAEGIAKSLAPVGTRSSWTKGHRFEVYPGYTREHIHPSLEHHYGPDGFCLGLLGGPAHPLNYLGNPASHKGFTWNRGHKSARPGGDNVLERALDAVPFSTIKVW